jgi:hypothetical protein
MHRAAPQDRFEDSDKDPPPIRVIIAQGGEDVTIKVSDEGGGIPRSGLHRIWTYMYSTAESVLDTGTNCLCPPIQSMKQSCETKRRQRSAGSQLTQWSDASLGRGLP